MVPDSGKEGALSNPNAAMEQIRRQCVVDSVREGAEPI
jgi:hypothetical protein